MPMLQDAQQQQPQGNPKQYKRAVQDDPNQQAAMQQGEEVPADVAGMRQSPTDVGDQEMYPWEKAASEESQAEYENAMSAMASVFYDNDGVFDNIMKMVTAEDPKAGLIKAASTLVTEVDKQIDIPEQVIPALPAQALDMVYEMAVKQGAIEEMADADMQSTVAAAQELIMRAYGMDTEDFGQLTQGLNEQNVTELGGIYNEATQGNGIS